ncbi:Aspartic proteinase nepenthesin-1 [Nymphaea thermarum]|nr:Aspartic proteinase nepenthesin-1 [Nymphaea thermarum]
MKLSLDTPSCLYWNALDTGSDLIWATCRPCDSWSGQTSMFDPLQSSTYKSQSCSASSFMELDRHGCTINQFCRFRQGILATKTLVFDDVAGTIELPEIVFGCLHNEGAPNPGLVGLGGGPLSLENQIGSFIDKKFAYCLPPYSNENNSMGQLKFGKFTEFSGKDEVQKIAVRCSNIFRMFGS